LREISIAEEFDDFCPISEIVKVWRPFPKIYLPPNESNRRKDGTYEKKGPYCDLGKGESHALSKIVMAEVNETVDWSVPDHTLTVKPKWRPTVQYVKF
jgi:hypothetical protein